jgi:hypothetical protein
MVSGVNLFGLLNLFVSHVYWARREFQERIPIPIVRMSGTLALIIRLQQVYPHSPSQATLDPEIVAAVVVAPEIDVDANIGDVVVHGEHAAADEHKTEIPRTDFSESDQASPLL